jgi:hypothetical protein
VRVCVCVRERERERERGGSVCVCERNKAYKLTGCINIAFTVDSNTILNTWFSGIVRNLREFF